MSKIIFTYKQKKSDAAWSSIINDLGQQIAEKFEFTNIITLDNSNFSSLLHSYKKLKGSLPQSDDIIIVNHAITYWLFLPLLIRYKFKGVKIIFLFHEHEHILGLKYCMKHFRHIKIKEYLRHFSWWYKVPYLFSSKVVCLSSYQGVSLAKVDFERLSYLGVDQKRFPIKKDTAKIQNQNTTKVLFAHDPTRFDKGDRFSTALKQDSTIEFIYGREQILDYAMVYKKYHNADIIFLPSDSESYSLVLAESLATNSCIVTNANVGIVQLLISTYSIDQLANFGLFISEHQETEYVKNIENAKCFLQTNQVKTYQLFELLALDQTNSFNRLSSFINRMRITNV
ncbi:hypothetical protein [Colwellia sp. E2M01]|uniref:glycosyltransferase n=1 Tax=Colwellia sp. E2M01 TaxID=2841561 RepID=UPI001C08B803|nr:hypothetical protein [Colwellia sp. E2M01]MBU2869369.1 hypothetical protein [Colwellia sp. E2M01]